MTDHATLDLAARAIEERDRLREALGQIASGAGNSRPSLDAAFLMAEVLQVPYREVMIAAIIPAFLYYLALFFQVDLEAAKRGIRGEPAERLPQTLAVLEREGLIQRRPDEDDRRVVHFSLTRAGQAELRRTDLPPGWETALADLPARERETATAALEQLLCNLQHRNAGRTFGACRSCRHLQRAGRQYRCGLNGEPLSADDTQRICHEHAYPETS